MDVLKEDFTVPKLKA